MSLLKTLNKQAKIATIRKIAKFMGILKKSIRPSIKIEGQMQMS